MQQSLIQSYLPPQNDSDTLQDFRKGVRSRMTEKLDTSATLTQNASKLDSFMSQKNQSLTQFKPKSPTRLGTSEKSLKTRKDNLKPDFRPLINYSPQRNVQQQELLRFSPQPRVHVQKPDKNFLSFTQQQRVNLNKSNQDFEHHSLHQINQLKHEIELLKNDKYPLKDKKIDQILRDSPLKKGGLNSNNFNLQRKRNIQDIITVSKLVELQQFLEWAQPQDLDSIPFQYSQELKKLSKIISFNLRI